VDTTGCGILLIDDEEANLDLLTMLLRGKGYRSLVRVDDAREAVAAFDAARPDLVLLDLHMPFRTGFEVLADLRERTPPGELLPVLVLTADVTPEAKERALRAGAHDFLTKPFDRTEVLLRVRNLLQTRVLYREQRRAREAAERTAARERLLAAASHRLSASLDTTTSLVQLAQLLAAEWVDACVVELHGADGPRRVAAAGAPEWGSELRVPLGNGVEPEGWLTVGRLASRPPLDGDDLALAREMAHRASLALQNARSFQSAQDALATRDQVLAIVAHDLRSPLTAVRMEVEMLRTEPAQPLASADLATLCRVEGAVLRMDGLIQDLLDVSRLNRGVLALERWWYDPGALLAEAAATLRPLVEGQGLSFEPRGPASLPGAQLDAARLLQAISNLVGNAAKFSRQNGRVTLAWEMAEEGELRIAVGDDGPGIAPEQLQHIFGAFWQARDADRRGLGLGLAIARAIVEAHGGRIWVESRVGHGSTFYLALPVGTPPAGTA
jgi:signal transduction histidine kinase